MKKIALLWLFLAPLYALHADMVLTESVETEDRTMNMSLKIKGDKIRVDPSPEMSLITDTTTGDTLTIMHPQKSYMMISGDKVKAIQEQIKKFSTQPAAAETPAGKPKFVDTGKSEQVGKFKTEIYTLDEPARNMKIWVTKEIPNYAALQEQLRKFQTMAMSKPGPATAFAAETSDLQGLPVKTQIVSNGKTMTITITSAEEKPIEDAEMAPPEGYTKISMPNFGGAGQQPPH